MSTPIFETADVHFDADNIRHGFFGRSSGAEHDLNMSENFGTASQVAKNFDSAATALCDSPLTIARLKQTHTNKVITIGADYDLDSRPEADGIVTDQKGIAIAILTADCCPLIFVDPAADIIGACHAGWKGAVNGIISETIEKMVQLGAEPSDIFCAIGPTISGQNYEVGPEFADDLRANHPAAAPFLFTPENKTRAHFDLPAFAAAEVIKSGAMAPAFVGGCTLADPSKYFSHRGASAKKSAAGRQAAMIALV